MKNIKNFKEFSINENFTINNDIDLYLNMVNKYTNNSIFNNKVLNLIESIPLNIRKKVENYYNSNNVVDIDKISYYINKYNLFNIIKKLYDKGITSFKEIYNRIINLFSPSNESLMGVIGTIIIVSAVLAFIIFGLYFIKKGISYDRMLGDITTGISLLVGAISMIIITLYFGNNEKKMYVKIDNKTEEIYIVKQDDNVINVEKIN